MPAPELSMDDFRSLVFELYMAQREISFLRNELKEKQSPEPGEQWTGWHDVAPSEPKEGDEPAEAE